MRPAVRCYHKMEIPSWKNNTESRNKSAGRSLWSDRLRPLFLLRTRSVSIIMPKTTVQKVIFGLLMSFFMVLAMEMYNTGLRNAVLQTPGS